MLGPVQSFLIVAILISISVLLIFGIRGIKSPSQKNQSEALLERLGKGVAYVWTHKLLFPAMVLDMVAVLFGGVVAVLPLFADQVLHTGPEGLGWLRAAPAIGSVLVSGILIRFPPGKNAGRRMIIAIVGFGLSNLLFALSNSFYWSLCLLFFAGMFDSYSMVVRGALLQLFTPDEMKGRVSAVNSIFIGSSNELGAFESGLAARFMGLVPSVVFGAFVTFASTGVAWFRAKDLSQLDLSQGES
jgi:predicted MFS family arabinose efflux permease